MRLLLTTCALLLATTPVVAQTIDPDALVREGVGLRRAHRDAEALTRFEEAYRTAPTPRALAQIGLAEQALGWWTVAETHVRDALGAASDPWIASNTQALRAALAVIGQHLGALWVEGPPGAEVFVDGERLARLPMATAARVIAGSLVIEVRAAGYVTVTRPLVVPAGGEAREVVRMTPTAPTESTTAAPVTGLMPAAPLAGPRPTARSRGLAWAALAGSVVGLGVGVGALVGREGTVADYNSNHACPGVQSATAQPSDCQGQIDRASTLGLVEAVALAAGGALAVTSLVLFVTSPSASRSAERPAPLACAATVGAWGISCAGQF